MEEKFCCSSFRVSVSMWSRSCTEDFAVRRGATVRGTMSVRLAVLASPWSSSSFHRSSWRSKFREVHETVSHYEPHNPACWNVIRKRWFRYRVGGVLRKLPPTNEILSLALTILFFPSINFELQFTFCEKCSWFRFIDWLRGKIVPLLSFRFLLFWNRDPNEHSNFCKNELRNFL